MSTRGNLLKPSIHSQGIRSGHPLARGLVTYWPFWSPGGGWDLLRGYNLIPYNAPALVPTSRGLAWLFDDTSNEYLKVASVPLSTTPMTFSAWFNADVSHNGSIVTITDTSAGQYDRWLLKTDSGGELRAASNKAAVTSNTYTVNEWSHGLAKFSSATYRECILNGDLANKGTNSETESVSGVDSTLVGATEYAGGSRTWYFSGHIAQVAIWNRALSDDEAVELYQDPWGLLTPPSTRTVLWVAATSVGGGVAYNEGTKSVSADAVVTVTDTALFKDLEITIIGEGVVTVSDTKFVDGEEEEGEEEVAGAIDRYPTAEYDGDIHGELITDGDASTLTAINLYKSGTVTAISELGDRDFLYITDVTVFCEDEADIALVADSEAAGRYILTGHVAANTVVDISFKTPYCCPAGVIPKFAGGGANKSSCLVQGFLRSG